MLNWKKTNVIALTALTVLACARKREVEQKIDLDGNRYAKASFDNGTPWLGRVMIINSGTNSAFGFVGAQSDVKIGSFQFTQDKLQFVADSGLSKSGETRVINEWSIQHSDYFQRVSGGRTSNVETENDTIAWKDKKFFKVDWDNAAISEAATFPFEVDEHCWSRKGSRVVDGSMEVDSDHINFVVEVDYQISQLERCSGNLSAVLHHDEQTHTMRYMYSFMPERTSAYVPYVYAGENDPLTRKYGYFLSSSPFLNPEGRVENTHYMNRWALNKTHTIYFAEGFPEQYKWIYNDPKTGVIARTNELFASNGVDIKFEIKEADKDHKFGDIRYSFIKIVEDVDAQAPLGYGPATAHPRTGEIISSNTTMWTSSLLFYLQRVKDGQVAAKDRDLKSPLYKSMVSLLGKPSADWTSTANFLENQDQAALFRFLLPDFTYGNQGSSFANKGVEATATTNTKLSNYWANSGRQSDEFEEARSKAKQGQQDYFAKIESDAIRIQRNSTVWALNDAMFAGLDEVIASKSSQDIIDDIMYRTAIHEFGHNLNLRHNFYGSVDGASRRSTDKDRSHTVTTSVMDYLDLKHEIGLGRDWEPYDKAALLYAYSNGKIDKIKENGDPYLYCTDEHVNTNPLCNRFDVGSTPTEIVNSMIESYEDGYWTRNFRYGREFWNTRGYASDIYGTMYEMKKFLAFSRQAFDVGSINRNLTGRPDINPELPAAFSKAMAADMDEAVRLAAGFYTAVIKQDSGDRPFSDSYDSVSGALTRHGIMYDKYFAMEMLMGDQGIAIDPNKGSLVTSFFDLLGKDNLKEYMNGILSDVYLNAGSMYVGYEDMGRDIFISNASTQLNRAIAPTEQTRYTCFSEENLVKTFAVDLKTSTVESGEPTIVAIPKDSLGYFKNEGNVYVQYIDGSYYVAGVKKNLLAAKLMDKNDPRSILNSYRGFYMLTEGRVPECR
jgi:hypothetical protein